MDASLRRERAARVSASLKRQDFDDVVLSMRDAYDMLDDRECVALIGDEIIPATDIGDEAGWMSVAEALTDADSMFNLAVLMWREAGWERKAVEAMRSAHGLGDSNAETVLAEWLAWLGERDEAVTLLRRLNAATPGDAKVAGLLGRELAEGAPEASDQAIALLEFAAIELDEFLKPYAEALVSSARYQEARKPFEKAMAGGDVDAALQLGNLLSEHLQDPLAAETAYRVAIDAGDGYAAHNLATDLMRSGRVDEAIELLRFAVQRGDDDARETLSQLEQGRAEAP